MATESIYIADHVTKLFHQGRMTMPSAPHLVFGHGEYHGQTVHYRTGHLLLKVRSRSDDRADVIQVISEVIQSTVVREDYRFVADLLQDLVMGYGAADHPQTALVPPL